MSEQLSTYVDRPVDEVYRYVVDPAHLPSWAAGLGGSIEERDGRWFAESPMGEVEVRFVPENPYGVLDHDVTLPDGTVVTNPLRVLADGEGCEVVFTLRRRPEMSDAELAADATAVQEDLTRLKRLLENES